MSKFLLQSGRPHVPPAAEDGSLWDRLRSLESDLSNADTTEIDLARTGVIDAIRRSKALKQESVAGLKELSNKIIDYRNCQFGHSGEWTPLRDLIAFESGVSTRGLYRLIALSSSPKIAGGRERAPAADQNRAKNSCEGRPNSTTNRLSAEVAERVSKRIMRKNRSESVDDFDARIIADFTAQKGHTMTHSKAAAVQFMQKIMQTWGLSPSDFRGIRGAPD